jgi:hypothetical protein
MLLVYEFWHARGQLTRHTMDVPAIPSVVIAAGHGRAIIVGEYKSLTDFVRGCPAKFSFSCFFAFAISSPFGQHLMFPFASSIVICRYLDHIAIYRAMILYREGRIGEAYHANLGWCEANERYLLHRIDHTPHPEHVVLPDSNSKTPPIVLRPLHTFSDRDVATAWLVFASLEYGRDYMLHAASNSSSISREAKTQDSRPLLLPTDVGTRSPALRSLVNLASLTSVPKSTSSSSSSSSSSSISNPVTAGPHGDQLFPLAAPITGTRTGLQAVNHFVNTAVRFVQMATTYQQKNAGLLPCSATNSDGKTETTKTRKPAWADGVAGRQPPHDRSKPNTNPSCPAFPAHGPMRSRGRDPPYNYWMCHKLLNPKDPTSGECGATIQKK